MPIYQYHCPANGRTVEVFHRMSEDLQTWGEVRERLGEEPGETADAASVERILYAVGVSTPVGDSKLKEMGFTKLVRRDRGVYENVTATDGEKRYMRADDPSSVPHVHKKVGS